MNLDEIFGLDAASPMVSTNPFLLLASVASAVAVGWLCVLKYRNTYDIEKSIRLYLPFALAGVVVFSLVGIPLLFSIGAQLCGLVALVWISGYYFKK